VKRRGLARHIGVSNFTTRLLEEAWRATEEPIVVLQCEYHPYLNQDKLLTTARSHKMAFTAYSPLGQGDVLRDPTVTGIAKRLGRAPAQIVLRWLIQQKDVAAIPKSAHLARIRENIDVFDFDLETGDMASISALARPDGRLVRDPDLAPEWDIQ
jgi:2,5-diketo-D-gluconate reductase B